MIFHKGWVVAYTKPKHEKKVSERFHEIGAVPFLPTAKKLSRWRDRNKIIDAPLFPNYVFLHIEQPHQVYDIYKVPGFLYFVKAGNEIARVKEEDITQLLHLTACGDSVTVTTDYFEPGTMLTIQQGPMTGLGCEMVKYKNNEMVIVRVPILQRSVLATIPALFLGPQCT